MKTSTSALKLRVLAFALALVTPVFLSATARAAEIDVIPDVVYGHKDGLAMTFDIIKPKINANGAAILFHGERRVGFDLGTSSTDCHALPGAPGQGFHGHRRTARQQSEIPHSGNRRRRATSGALCPLQREAVGH